MPSDVAYGWTQFVCSAASVSLLMQVHVQLSSAQQELARAQLGWEPWSGTLYPGPVNRPVLCSPALAGISLEVQVTLGGVGLSLVGQQQEVLYGRVSGIQVRAVTGVARQTLELAVQQVQVTLTHRLLS